MHFCNFLIISPLKKEGPFTWINLDHLDQSMLCAKFGWNWPSGSGEMHFCNFVIIPPWKRVGPFIWIKLNSLHQSIHCAKLGWKLAQWLLRRIFLKMSMYFHNCTIISPWKRRGPSFEQTWIPITKKSFVPSLVEISPIVLEKKIF